MNDDMTRVPMRPKPTAWLTDDDVQVSMDRLRGPRIGRRLSMDIDEIALAQFSARAVEHATKVLAEHIAARMQPDIERAVYERLHDIKWMQQVVESEMRRTVRDFVMSLWSDDEKKNLRDWFDLFTAQCRGDVPPPAQ
jgi:hypothetical protein